MTLLKKEFRSATALFAVSKILEKLMHKQTLGYIENFLPLYLCNYRISFSTQQAVLALTEN